MCLASNGVVAFQDPEMEPYRWKFKTLGGQQFWTDVQIVDGWKIQRNEVYGRDSVYSEADFERRFRMPREVSKESMTA